MKKNIPFHPFLFALFPILFLFSFNLKNIIISLNELALPLIFSLILAGISWLLFFLLLWQKHKAAVLASSVILLVFSHGHFFNLLKKYISEDSQLILFEFLIFFAILFCTLKIKGDWKNFSKILNLVSLFLILYSSLQIGIYKIQAKDIIVDKRDLAVNTENINVDYKPDIYYIILDAYSRNDVLKEINGFDNSSFTEYLEAHDFFVASKSTSNYATTRLSITSSLNFDYLSNSDLNYQNYWKPYKKFTNNAVFDFLKGQGYSISALSSGFTFTELKGYVDFYFSPSFRLTEFQNVLLATTPLPSFLEMLSTTSQFDLHREQILYSFEKLSSFDNIKSPKFVFAHIISPHEPYVFGKDGEAVDSSDTFGLKNYQDANKSISEKYINQLQYINKKVSETITKIQDNSEKPPVIIIQADHAHGLACSKRSEVSCRYKRMSILNAYSLPNFDKNVLYDDITPVNTFRLIFNNYFGTNFELLDDKNYANGNTEFIEVTGQLKNYK